MHEERHLRLLEMAVNRVEIDFDKTTGEYVVTQLFGTEFIKDTDGTPIIGRHSNHKKAREQYENCLRDFIRNLADQDVVVLTAKLVKIPRQCCYKPDIFPDTS